MNIGASSRIRRIATLQEHFIGGERAIASRDGGEVYMFMPGGRHSRRWTRSRARSATNLPTAPPAS